MQFPFHLLPILLPTTKKGLGPKPQPIVLNKVMVMLVACCVTKCQEVPIRLAQIWRSVSQLAPEKSCLTKIL